MPGVSDDIRIVKTREALVGALMDLVGETSWKAVTVAGVCRRARVHRATFYAHYENKADLLARSLPDFFDALAASGRDTGASMEAQFAAFFHHCRSRIAFYRKAFTEGNEFRSVLLDYLRRHAIDAGPGGRDLESRFAAGGVVAVVEAFVQAQPTPDPEVTAAHLAGLSLACQTFLFAQDGGSPVGPAKR